MYSENRFKMLTRSKPEEAKVLLKQAQEDVNTRWQMYQYLAERHFQGSSSSHQNGHSGTQPQPDNPNQPKSELKS
jgi:pyruvate-ferredoxin/flavodoxin oxidoreductase